MIPYGHQSIDKSDIKAVTNVLQSDRLTQGPVVEVFEKALAEYCGTKYAVVFSSGTAGLHAAYFAAGLGKGDEFITSPLTFVATANAGLYLGADPVFCDVDEYGNLDPESVKKKITRKTRLISVVDYAGNPARLDEFKMIAKKFNITLVEDACHALGATYRDKRIGSISNMTVFSFHPVKTITTGEGGAVVTNDKNYFDKLILFRSHGITKDEFKFKGNAPGDWYYEMQELGFNYRMTDIQAALGISQLKKISKFLDARRRIAQKYSTAFKSFYHQISIIPEMSPGKTSWHLYVVLLKGDLVSKKYRIFRKLIKAGIGVQTHYIPVYLQPYYQALGYKKGQCPQAEAFYNAAISLPIFVDLTSKDQKYVIKTFISIINNAST